MPGIDEKILEQEIRQLVSEITEVEPDKIKLETKFIEDLGMFPKQWIKIRGVEKALSFE